MIPFYHSITYLMLNNCRYSPNLILAILGILLCLCISSVCGLGNTD
ncbi:hypothetical protein CFP56_007879 [Quercus suber]|uniref:Uncharacterized protein n=1 Tax=Quercus suber TaxID=58331 RepID=A0AAW0L558_QUESU